MQWSFNLFFFAPQVFFSLPAHGRILTVVRWACRIQYDDMALHCLVYFASHNNIVYLSRSFVTTELVSL